MEISFWDAFVQDLKTLKFFPIPCRKEEVDFLESSRNIILPRLYKEFLLLMGKGAGQFMVGSLFFYSDFQSIREGAIDLLKEHNLPSLPHEAFVFFCHQGYVIAYFITGEGDNPPVYILSETETDIKEIKVESFTKFLVDELSAYKN